MAKLYPFLMKNDILRRNALATLVRKNKFENDNEKLLFFARKELLQNLTRRSIKSLCLHIIVYLVDSHETVNPYINDFYEF